MARKMQFDTAITNDIKFGKRIREVRENAGLKQKEFCASLGIPQSTLSAYETDRMQPTVASLINIAIKFNVSLDWLCGIEKIVQIEPQDDLSNQEIEEFNKLSADLKAALDEAEDFLQELKTRRKGDNK